MPDMVTSPRRPAAPIDERAFAAFLAAMRPRALKFLRRLGCGDAEDVVQETLARVWQYRAAWDPQGNPEAWLMRATFRVFLDHRRRTTRQPATGGEVDGATVEPPCRAELRDEIARGLARLAPIERALLLGFHVDGRSLRELADAHGLVINTVKSHLHRARRKLLPGGAP